MPIGRGDRRDQRIGLDLPLVVAIGCISVLGLLNLRSAVSVVNLTYYETQLRWFGVGGLAVLVFWLIDHRVFLRFAYTAYAGVLVLLFLVLAVGREANQAQRWLHLGALSIQPSEFMKIALILSVARWFHGDVRPEPRTLKDFLLPVALTAVPTFLVVRQPDLGTALTYPIIFLSMVSVLRIRLRTILFSLAAIAVAVPIAWSFLREYQQDRVLTLFTALFAQEQLDVQGEGWQTTQSIIAVGSGGLFGKGFMRGTQNQGGFVPFQHTDFPFAVWCEEHGFVGALILGLLYLFVVLWGIRIASRARDRFAALAAVGISAMVFWHVAINLGMVLGLLPVVGVTLPLFSYGGSSVLANLIGVGILLSISARRVRAPWES
jgi:rod shape determining protein RodA